MGGRPVRRAYVQRFATRRRCQSSSVIGVTKNSNHLTRGSSLLAAVWTRPIRRPQGGPLNLPAQHRQLVPEHESY